MRQNTLIAGIVSGALCFTIGFGGGALLTRPSREKTEAAIATAQAKAEEAQATAQQEIKAAELETELLRGKLKRLTAELKQVKNDNELLASQLQEARSATRVSSRTKKATKELIPYKIINREEFLDYKISFDIRVGRVNGKLPTEKQLADISHYLKSKEKPHKRTFVCFYLPDMEVGAGAWATAHHNPDLKVWISHSNKVTTGATNMHLGILADRYSDGNISVGFYSYDSKGSYSWVGEGLLTLIIKNEKGKIVKECEKSIDRQGVSLEIYMGSAIHSVRSMDAEYKTNNGKIYTQKNIPLERLLQE